MFLLVNCLSSVIKFLVFVHSLFFIYLLVIVLVFLSSLVCPLFVSRLFWVFLSFFCHLF